MAVYSSEDKPKPIRDASTLVLLREGARPDEFEVLLVRRNRGAAFMADAYVFPGGRVDESDRGDFRMAAAREAFEEVGVLLAIDGGGRYLASSEAPWMEAERKAVLDHTRALAELMVAHGLRLPDEDLVYFARWVTPPTEPRRFDARFFMARMPPAQEPRPDTAEEVVEFRWATPRAFLEDQRMGTIQLPPPTIWHLATLAQQSSIRAALAFGKAQGELGTIVRPKLCPVDDVIAVLFPWDAGYESAEVAEGEALPKDHPVAAHLSDRISRVELRDGQWVAKVR